jgi:hypothetical protein
VFCADGARGLALFGDGGRMGHERRTTSLSSRDCDDALLRTFNRFGDFTCEGEGVGHVYNLVAHMHIHSIDYVK